MFKLRIETKNAAFCVCGQDEEDLRAEEVIRILEEDVIRQLKRGWESPRP